MMEKEFHEWAEFEKEMKKLPEKAQQAIYWVVKNFDFVMELCKKSDMTVEEIEKHREDAREKEDYIALALLLVAEMYKSKGPEAME